MGGASQPAAWGPKPGLEGKAVPQPGSQREGVRWGPCGDRGHRGFHCVVTAGPWAVEPQRTPVL